MSRGDVFQVYTEAYSKAKSTVTDPEQFLVVAQWIADRLAAREPLDLDTFIEQALAAPKEA